MIKKNYYIIMIFLFILGLFISYVIIPRENELAFMLFKDKQFYQALNRYEKLYKEGKNEISVIIPLTKLYLQFGKVSLAVKIMEQFVNQNPNFIEARKHLGTLYQYDQRPKDYADNLEIIYNLSPDSSTARKLAEIYNFYGRIDDQISILNDLINNFKPIESDYVKLAYLYSAHKELDLAENCFDKLLDNFDISDLQPQTIEFAVSLFISQKKEDKAFNLANSYLNKINDPEYAITFANYIQKIGNYKLALKLLKPYEDIIDKNPEILNTIVNLRIQDGNKYKVYTELRDLYTSSRLDEVSYETLVELAIDTQDEKLLRKISREIDLKSLSEEIIFSYLESLIDTNNLKLVKSVHKNFGKKFLDESISINLILYSMDGNFISPSEINNILSKQEFPLIHKIYIIRVLNKMGSKLASIEMLKSIGIEIPNNLTYDIAELFIKLKQIDLGLNLFTKIRNKQPSSQINTIWAMLKTAKGEETDVLNWLQNKGSIDRSDLRAIAEIAVEYKRKLVAIDVGEFLYNDDPKPVNAVLYAEGLNLNEKYKEAIDIINPYIDNTIDAQNVYLNAMGKAIKHGVFKDDELVKQKDIFRKFINKVASQDNMSTIQIRELAFILLENNFKKDAERLFFKIANHASAESQDVAQLLFLWGPRPKFTSIQWLRKRAFNSEGDERGKWLRHLYNVNKLEIVQEIIESDEFAYTNKEIMDVYIDLLIKTKQYSKLSETLGKQLTEETNSKRLIKMANLAMGNKSEDIAWGMFKKVLRTNPNSKESLKNLGAIAFFKGRYNEAKNYLTKFLRNNDDYKAQYYMGELLWIDNEYNKADSFFDKSLINIKKMKLEDNESKMIEARILLRKNKIKKAINIFENLILKEPYNSDLHVEFANILMEVGDFDRAKEILSRL